ncbi:MAG: Gfo/Idh/MocA family oxidoreductase, partial [bacterium]|nr:Gfo/Idh/MocA family oxidoreductase [bacterium]MDW8164030.1 Gfo/Idh/MocA family oxidoreductase [Candidatus Omnitrophota bacterium]
HAAVYSQLPDVKIVGIADIRGDKAKSLAIKFKTIPYFDPDQLINKEDVNLIDICLPTFLHKEYVIKAAEAGKDIICEKPIALTTEDADEMIKICEKNKVRFAIAQVLRFWPEYKYLKDIYDSGKYGKLLTITMRRVSPIPTWSWQDWFLDQEKSGGAVIDLHIHDTDFLLYLLNEKPKKIYSKISKKNSLEVHIFTVFTFINGLIAEVEGGFDFPPNFPFEMSYTAKFEKATVDFNSNKSPSLVVYEFSGKIDKPTFQKIKANGIEGNIEDLGGYFYELRYFVDHIIHNKPFQIVTPQDAKNSLEIVLKERESAIRGGEISLE